MILNAHINRGFRIILENGRVDDEMRYHIDQHAAYVDNWLSVLKGDKKRLLSAISDASKIANLVSTYEN